jgi:hypothetical protein
MSALPPKATLIATRQAPRVTTIAAIGGRSAQNVAAGEFTSRMPSERAARIHQLIVNRGNFALGV